MTEKLDEQTDRQIAELEEMAAQVYAALAHHRADALRTRIRELIRAGREEGGFTREDVTRIRDEVNGHLSAIVGEYNGETWEEAQACAVRLSDIADRIEARLPPEGTP